MAVQDLSAAFNALQAFWVANPTGGTRGNFVTSQTNAGFVEPMLSNWLDDLLNGLRDSGFIAVSSYNSNLVPLIAAVGLPAVVLACRATFNFLSQYGGSLYKDTRRYMRDQLTLKIDATTVEINDTQSARTFILALAPFTGQTFATKALKDKIDALQLLKTSLQDAKQDIVDELAIL